MAYEREQRIRDILWKEREILLTSAGEVNREQMAEYLNEAGYAIENLISLNQYMEEYNAQVSVKCAKYEDRICEQDAEIRNIQSAIATWFIDTYGRESNDKVSRETNSNS